MRKTAVEIEVELAQKEIELQTLQDQLTVARRKEECLTPERRLATAIHQKLCHWNHTDQCAWEYRDDYAEETWKDNGERREWLEKARRILAQVDIDTAIKTITLL